MSEVRTSFDKPLRYKISEWKTDTKRGAHYHISGRKNPVAYSTNAELETLTILGSQFNLLDIAKLYNSRMIILSETEKQVIEVLISYGKETVSDD